MRYAVQDAFGASFGEGLQHSLRLLRTHAALTNPDHHLLPLPRGLLSDLKLVPLDPALPGVGHIKV